MARPQKNGLDYFPLDTVFDTKMRLFLSETRLTGLAVIIRLFQKIYGEEGYYCDWTKDAIILFADEIHAGINTVIEIINLAIKRGIFNSALYDKYKILTSVGIQKRYIKARKSNFERIKKEYLLVLVSETGVLSGETGVLSGETGVLSGETPIKESKIKKKKENKSINYSDDFLKFWSAYPRHTAKSVAFASFERIEGHKELLPQMLEAVEREKKSKQWQRDNGEFIPIASTWLNQRRWEDEDETENAPSDSNVSYM